MTPIELFFAILPSLIVSVIMAMFNHRTNIKRLFAGTENKISFGKIEQK